MDLWIDADYAEEFAVIAAWLGVLVPWNITFFSPPGFGSFLYVRFPLFQIRYAFDSPLSNAFLIKSAPGALVYQGGGTLFSSGYRVWVAGAIIFAFALLLSLALFLYDERLADVTWDLSRVMGWLLLATGIVLTVSTVYLMSPNLGSSGVVYIPIPIGLLGFYALAGVLLFVERR